MKYKSSRQSTDKPTSIIKLSPTRLVSIDNKLSFKNLFQTTQINRFSPFKTMWIKKLWQHKFVKDETSLSMVIFKILHDYLNQLCQKSEHLKYNKFHGWRVKSYLESFKINFSKNFDSKFKKFSRFGRNCNISRKLTCMKHPFFIGICLNLLPM